MKEKHPNYFEGLLQLRNYTPDLLEWVKNKIQKDNKAKIAKIKKTKNGIDIYLSSQHYLTSIGKKINENFKGTLKISRKLFTQHRITSKFVYRITVLFKQTQHKKGDIIEYQGENYQIIHIDSQITIKNTKTGKKEKIKPERIEKNK